MGISKDEIAGFVIENAREGIISFDKELKCTYWSPAMEKMTGLSREECLGNEMLNILPYLGKTGEIKFLERTLHGQSIQLDNRFLFIPEKGRSAYYSVQYYPIQNSLGEITAAIGIFQETTPYMSVIHALQEAEEKYIQLVNQAPLSIVVFTMEEILFVNKAALHLLGLQEEMEMLGKSPLLFVGKEDQQKARQNISDILSGKIQKPLKHVLQRADGSELDAEITYLAMSYLGKEAIQAIIRNITEEKKAYEELIQHKRLLSEAQKMAKLGSYQFFLEDNSIIWSDEIYRIFEEDKASFQPNLKRYLSFMGDSAAKKLLALIEEIKEESLKEAEFSHEIYLRNGKKKAVRFTAKPILNEKGQALSVVGTLQDISEQRKVEEEINQANQILNMHFENSPLGVVQLDEGFRILGWSKQAEKILGWEASEIVGECLFSLNLIQQDCIQLLENLKENFNHSHFNYQKNKLKLYTKKGTIVYCEIFISGIAGQEGKLNSIFLLINDITTRQIMEKAREEGQLEERKRVAREIHDGIGQMLIAIKYKISGLEDFLPEVKQAEIQHIESLVEQALEEVRSVSNNLAPRSVAKLGLESSLRQMCEQIKKTTTIDLKFRYIGGEQEINHKIVNALYRIGQEATHNIIKHAQANHASIQVFQGRNFIELKVEDNGKGIPEQRAEGMGLKNMEERAHLLGGRFQLHSDRELGTTIIVNIPLEQF